MKAYKIRSLIYLSFFIIAAVVYYHIEQDETFLNEISSAQTADLEAEGHTSDEDVDDMSSALQ